MSRVFNFSAGPAALPVEVLEQLRDEMLEWRGEGMSLLESSHRGKEYDAVHEEALANVRELLSLGSGTTTRCSSCRAGRACSSRWCR